MTFDEYNTDANFDNDKSSLDELVKIGLSEGKTSDEIRTSLSPKWQKSKKIGEFDNYVSKYSTPKAEEPKPTEEKVTEKVIETTAPEKKDDKIKTSSLGGGEEQYYKDQKKRIEKAEGDTLNKVDELSDYNWKKEYDTASKMTEAYKRIDDKMVEQLPTFMFKRYQNGEFGDPKSGDAKLRLAHFMINGVQSKLKNASNAAALAAGRSPMFADTTSDYEKYQQTNLAKGMENRWKKYEAETQAAIDLATKEGMKEQDARLAVEQLTRDKQINTVWNMMDSNQKLYAMEVTKKIGDALGKMDISELGDFIAGAAYEGTMDKDKVVAIGLAKIIEKSPELINKIKDEGMKDMVLGLIGGGSTVTAGIGGLGSGSDSNGNETNLTGNIQNYKTIGGDTVSFDFADASAGKKIQAVYDDLIDRYKNGEIDEATFKEYYDPMYAESKKHPGSFKTFFSSGSDEAIRKANVAVRVEVSDQIDALNEQAKNGEIRPSKYNEKFKALKDKAQKYGASEKDLKSIDKGKVSDEKILKATERKNKKK